MLADLMFKTKTLLDDLEDFVSAELLRRLQIDETVFADSGMTLDYDQATASFTVRNCAPDFTIRLAPRKAVWALGFESFTLEYEHRTLKYNAAADELTEPEPPRAATAAAV